MAQVMYSLNRDVKSTDDVTPMSKLRKQLNNYEICLSDGQKITKLNIFSNYGNRVDFVGALPVTDVLAMYNQFRAVENVVEAKNIDYSTQKQREAMEKKGAEEVNQIVSDIISTYNKREIKIPAIPE